MGADQNSIKRPGTIWYLLNSIRVYALESISIMKLNYFSLWYRSINLIVCWFYFIINKVLYLWWVKPTVAEQEATAHQMSCLGNILHCHCI